MATHNLFTLITKHQPKLGHNVTLDDTNEQLERIKMFIQDLTHITNEIHWFHRYHSNPVYLLANVLKVNNPLCYEYEKKTSSRTIIN